MNKGTFEKSLIEKVGLEKKLAHTAAGIVIDSIIDGIKNEPKVTLIGFGTIDKILRQARKGRNPKTGAALDIDEKIALRFKPGKELKEKINGSKVTINVDAETESQTEEEALQAELEATEDALEEA